MENGGVRAPRWEVTGVQKWKVRVGAERWEVIGVQEQVMGIQGWDGTEVQTGEVTGMKVEGEMEGDEGCDMEV